MGKLWENCGTRFLGVYFTCVVRQENSDMEYFFQIVLARIVAIFAWSCKSFSQSCSISIKGNNLCYQSYFLIHCIQTKLTFIYQLQNVCKYIGGSNIGLERLCLGHKIFQSHEIPILNFQITFKRV